MSAFKLIIVANGQSAAQQVNLPDNTTPERYLDGVMASAKQAGWLRFHSPLGAMRVKTSAITHYILEAVNIAPPTPVPATPPPNLPCTTDAPN